MLFIDNTEPTKVDTDLRADLCWREHASLLGLDRPYGLVKSVVLPNRCVQTYCWTPGILLSAMRAILYVVGSGLKGSRLRTTYLIMRSSTCNKIEGCQTHPRRILLNSVDEFSGLMPTPRNDGVRSCSCRTCQQPVP